MTTFTVAEKVGREGLELADADESVLSEPFCAKLSDNRVTRIRQTRAAERYSLKSKRKEE
ncbi:MAG: hypothetical protein DMG64_13350 [Acidobacteria bacterium]|nr:MAG: hypothetical protein DMG64_13350 [Acidobacteriota bacterium]